MAAVRSAPAPFGRSCRHTVPHSNRCFPWRSAPSRRWPAVDDAAGFPRPAVRSPAGRGAVRTAGAGTGDAATGGSFEVERPFPLLPHLGVVTDGIHDAFQPGVPVPPIVHQGIAARGGTEVALHVVEEAAESLQGSRGGRFEVPPGPPIPQQSIQYFHAFADLLLLLLVLAAQPFRGRLHGGVDRFFGQKLPGIPLRGELLHAEEHHVAKELPLELPREIHPPLLPLHAGSEFRLAQLLQGALVQQWQVGGDEAVAQLGPGDTSQHRPGHAQAQVGKGNEVTQPLPVQHVVAGIDGTCRRHALACGRKLVTGNAGGVLAIEEAVQAPREIVQHAKLVVAATQPAVVTVRLRGRSEAEQVGHVVIGGVLAGACRLPVKAAGSMGLSPAQLMQKGDDILEKIARHHRRRHRGIAHHLAGEQGDSARREDAVEVVEVVHRQQLTVALPRALQHAELLVAVEEQEQQPVVLLRHAPQQQVGDVAHP